MEIKTGNKTISIPLWAVLVGLEVVDNVVCNICKVRQTKALAKAKSKAMKGS